MAGNTMKEMTTNFGKLDKFEGHDFRRLQKKMHWQKKMRFLLTTLKVVYVLTTPMPKLMKDSTVEAIRIRAKWENDDYICRGHILNGMFDSLFDVYTNVKSAKELWDSLESKYMTEDSSSKKFLVSNFNNYKMVDSRPLMEQYNELLRILRQYTQHGLKMDESISVSSIIDKLPPSWKEFKHTLKHGKDDLSLVQLGSHFNLVVYLLTTPMPELMKDSTVEAIRIRAKWENDNYICRGHILNGMSHSLFDVYTNVESAKELWDSLESKYMAEDSSNKKFLVSNFNNYKMVDSRPVMEQYNELLRILRQYTQHGLKMDESIYVSSIIDKFPPSWKDFKHTLKHGWYVLNYTYLLPLKTS
ncbi:zinc finger, CCHC-type containing protein [Tanacetum coccineum]